MIKIYGSPRSSAARCLWMLEELNLKYEVQTLNMKDKEHKGEAFLKINPNGKIPALIDGDVTMFESMAINTYLSEKYPSDLTPKTAEERGFAAQWSYWASNELQPPALDWLIQALFVPEESRNHEIIEKAKTKLPGILSILDKQLTGKKYLVGNRFTVAEINVGTVVNLVKALQYDLSPYKEITRWMGQIADRPAFQKLEALRK